MANISRDAVLSAAWMLMRRSNEAASADTAMDRSDTSGSFAEQASENTHVGQAYTKEVVKKLITAYLYTPTHISSPFHSW